MALLKRPDALIALGLIALGCAAAKHSEHVAKPASAAAQAEASSGCAPYDTSKARVDAAIASGNLLGARRLLEQAALRCLEAEQARANLALAPKGASTDASSLLASASLARSQGKVENARRAEASAVSLLEANSGERLRVTQRWSVDSPHALPNVPYVFMTLDEQVLIMGAHSGRLHARIPQPKNDQFEIDLNANGTRVLARAVDLSQIGAQDGCASSINIFDAQSGTLLKHECATAWAFSGDGSRLALARLIGWGNGAIMKVVVLDTKTLEPVIELPEPGNVNEVRFAPDGTTLVVRWSHGYSLTDIVSGKTENFMAPDHSSWGGVTFGGGYATWQLGSNAHVWNLAEHTHMTFPLGTCRHVTISSSGSRLAASCPSGITLWSLPDGTRAAARRLSSFSLPKDSTFFSMQFLPHERTLAFELQGPTDTYTKPALYDTKLGRWLALPNPLGDYPKLEADLGLLLLGNAPRSLFAVDEQAQLRQVPLPKCEPIELASANGSAVVTCSGQDLLAVVLDLKTLKQRSFPVGTSKQTVQGNTLISGEYSTLELRDLSTGALLLGSPVSAAPTAWDGWWDGSSFVTVAARGDKAEVHVAHFGARLSRETLTPPSTERCPEHRGRVAWSAQQPYSVCNRKTGAVTAELPAAAMTGDQFERPALSDDGSFAISGKAASQTYRVADGEHITLAENPSGLEFVSADLLVGYDKDYDWGFWSAASGRRLTHSSERLGNLPIAASAQLNLALEPGRPFLRVRDFSGKPLSALKVDQRGEIALSGRGVASVVEPSRVSFFQLPAGERLGVLLNHPQSGELGFLAGTGEFELSGAPLEWRELLRCQVGLHELPLDVCIDAWLEPGIAGRKLLGVASN